jgi:hypothetical protein
MFFKKISLLIEQLSLHNTVNEAAAAAMFCPLLKNMPNERLAMF